MRRVFVSSTFRDMQVERDVLRKVASTLDAEASGFGESVSFCDLRWGVDTLDLDGDSGAAKVLDVCLDMIDSCRPYMIVLLGDRYGWIPDRSVVRSALRGRGGFGRRATSVTELEIEYGVLRHPEQLPQTLFYFREGNLAVFENDQEESAEQRRRLQSLKARIVRAGGLMLFSR